MFMSSEYTKRGREERKREMEKRLEINEKKRLTQVMRSLSRMQRHSVGVLSKILNGSPPPPLPFIT
jgi:hypothetical protein